MKSSNTVKVLIFVVVILCAGFIVTSKLLSTDKKIEHLVTHKSVNQVIKKIFGQIENTDENETNINNVTKVGIAVVSGKSNESIPNEDHKTNNVDAPTGMEEPLKEDEQLNEEESIKEENKDPKNNEDTKNNNKEDKKDKKNKDDKEPKDNKKNKEDKKDKVDKKIIEYKYISEDKAKEIAINKVGNGAKLIKIKSKFNDNPPKYELELILGNYEYELEVHAITGAIIDFKKEDIDD